MCTISIVGIISYVIALVVYGRSFNVLCWCLSFVVFYQFCDFNEAEGKSL